MTMEIQESEKRGSSIEATAGKGGVPVEGSLEKCGSHSGAKHPRISSHEEDSIAAAKYGGSCAGENPDQKTVGLQMEVFELSKRVFELEETISHLTNEHYDRARFITELIEKNKQLQDQLERNHQPLPVMRVNNPVSMGSILSRDELVSPPQSTFDQVRDNLNSIESRPMTSFYDEIVSGARGEFLCGSEMFEDPKLRRNQCKICYKIFPSINSMKVHRRVHADTPLYNCSLCSRNFSTKGNRRVHYKFKHPTFYRQLLTNPTPRTSSPKKTSEVLDF